MLLLLLADVTMCSSIYETAYIISQFISRLLCSLLASRLLYSHLASVFYYLVIWHLLLLWRIR